MISKDGLSKLLGDFLPRQRWFGAREVPLESITVEHMDMLRRDWPLLAQIVALAEPSAGPPMSFHLLVGARPLGEATPALGSGDFTIGEADTDLGPGLAYDALGDPELARVVLSTAAPHLPETKHVRPVTTEQSNTSLIYDGEFILKIFRRLHSGANPDVEVPARLWEQGFREIPEPLAEWWVRDAHAGVVRRYLKGGSDGWALALTSLRDLFGAHGSPAQAGGDFAAEAGRLGETTARMHLALVVAYGSEPGDPKEWARGMLDQVERVHHPDLDSDAAREKLAEVGSLGEVGPAIRVHGDFHLGQVMRVDEGWVVMDFEGEPARSLDERVQTTSPLKDVAGMLRSFDYAARSARPEDEPLQKLAAAWDQRNRQAFLDGYLGAAHTGGILPPDVATFEQLLAAFELDKAIYEVAYEQAHRPDWVEIPLQAVRGLVGTP